MGAARDRAQCEARDRERSNCGTRDQSSIRICRIDSNGGPKRNMNKASSRSSVPIVIVLFELIILKCLVGIAGTLANRRRLLN